MIVPDVNVLLYALHPAGRDHAAHRDWLRGAMTGTRTLGLLDVVLTGVVRLATHPRVFSPPASRADALAFVADLRSAPAARPVPSNDAVWRTFADLVGDDPQAVGNLVPDAFIAAHVIANGAELATADRGMARWTGLERFEPVGP